MSQEELSSLLEEKDEIIEDLRSEGEKLSKQVGKHSDIIKKLRTKEKANEKEIKKLKKELEETKSENERLTKSLNAKDEVETKQIEAITNLTSANSKWEEEHNKVSCIIIKFFFDPLSRPTIAASSAHCFRTYCPSVPTFQNLAQQNKFQVKTMRECG